MTSKGPNIQLEILKALDACAPYAMPEETLLTQVECLVPGRLLRSEFDAAIRRCEAERLIAGINAALGRGVRWTITDHGRGQLVASSN